MQGVLLAGLRKQKAAWVESAASEGSNREISGFPGPQRTYLFKVLYKEIMIRSPKR